MARQELEIMSGRGNSLQKVYLDPVRNAGSSRSLYIENLTMNILVTPPVVRKKVVVKRIRFRTSERAFNESGRLFTAAVILSVTAAWLIASFYPICRKDRDPVSPPGSRSPWHFPQATPPETNLRPIQRSSRNGA